jgi:hypothetical protein
MTLMPKKSTLHHLGLLVTLFSIASCGGGGGGGSTTNPSFVGTYLGTAETTVTGPQVSLPARGSIQIVVSSDNTVSVSDPGQPPYATGTLSGNTFVATAPGSTFNSQGVSCSGSLDFNGTISATSINGTISSRGLTCNGVGVNISGTFTATLRAQALAHGTGGGFAQSLRDAIRPQ